MLRRGLGESLRRRRDHERISPPCLKIKKEAHKAQNGRGAYGIEGMRILQKSLVGFESGKTLGDIPSARIGLARNPERTTEGRASRV